MSPTRRRKDDFYGGGDLEAVYPQPAPDPYAASRAPAVVERGVVTERPPGLMVRTGRRLDDWRRRVIPLPDEIIDQYLGHGERVIHSDHPSLQAFVVENTLLFAGLLVVALAVIGIALNGSLLTAALTMLILTVVLLVLVLKRLSERYTTYVVTNVRIMRIKGIISRRAHSIPWVRVTDLTYEQTLAGRLFGFATLHIESANEDSGLRDLQGVSDPMRFNQYVVDMVVAKQGPTAPMWEQLGEPAPIVTSTRVGFRDRLRAVRRRRTRVDIDHGGTTVATVSRPREPSEPVLLDPSVHEVHEEGADVAGTVAETLHERDFRDLDPRDLAPHEPEGGEPGDDLDWRNPER
ncbi:MAG TPA: PH domain-containing protein [Acidimicrobiales bacterium]|nr:PH domain-containing protein [Acidimicrobiales bacterium]